MKDYAVKCSLNLAALSWTQAKERYLTHGNNSAEKIANFLLNEAKTWRTKDNTSVLYIDFETAFST